MATNIYTLRGEAQWPKLFEENKDTKYHEGGIYQLTINVSDEEAEKFEDTGSATKVKFDRKTKQSSVTLRRKHEGKYEWQGGPPKVFNEDGSERTYADGIIWNGSEVEAEFEVYTTPVTVGTRLRSVKIIKMATPPEMDGEEEKPKEAPKAKAKAKPEVEDDEIPF